LDSHSAKRSVFGLVNVLVHFPSNFFSGKRRVNHNLAPALNRFTVTLGDRAALKGKLASRKGRQGRKGIETSRVPVQSIRSIGSLARQRKESSLRSLRSSRPLGEAVNAADNDWLFKHSA
jgi:hypothetical protein